MKKKFYKTFFLCLGLVFSTLEATPKACLDRVQAFLILKDPLNAYQEAKEASFLYPDNKELKKIYLIAAAEALPYCTSLEELLKNYQTFSEEYPEWKKDRWLQEKIAWGILKRGGNSSSPEIRFTALQGAFYARDADSVFFLEKALEDNNQIIRSFASFLTRFFVDERIKKKAFERIQIEKDEMARLLLIESASLSKNEKVIPLLEEIGKKETSLQAKAIIMEALAKMYEGADIEKLTALSQSEFSFLRGVVPEVIFEYEKKGTGKLLLNALNDCKGDIRAEALFVLSFLTPEFLQEEKIEKEVQDKALLLINDPQPLVRIGAAFFLTLKGDPKGLLFFKNFLEKPEGVHALLAASLLGKTGQKGRPLIESILKNKNKIPSYHSLIKANIALSYLGEEASFSLTPFLKEAFLLEEPLSFRRIGPFEVLTKEGCGEENTFGIETKEDKDEIARLTLLQALALKDENVSPLLKKYLQNKGFRLKGTVVFLLLKESVQGEEILEAIKPLLEDKDEKIRLEGALLLSYFGEEEKAESILIEAYPQASESMKGILLEAIARVGNEKSLPFLIEKMGEKRETLSLLAAYSLLIYLYK